MRVRQLDSVPGPALEHQEAAAAAAPDNSKVFARKLTSLSSDAYDQKIRSAIDAITKQGEIVCKKADLAEFRKYREMVRSLMDETVSNAFEFSKSMRFDSRGRAKTFAVIKKVNTRLEAMTQELLKDETDNLELMDSVDDIRGLLVDLFL